MAARERLLVATDLDACLLDERSYRWDEARPALDLLRERGALLVLASSKTRAEMEPLAESLDPAAPLIVENGGGLVLPERLLAAPPPEARRDGRSFELALGAPRAALVDALAAIARETGARVAGFASMDADEVARLTGLDAAAAALALRRAYDEPFLAEGGAGVDALAAAAERRGLRLTRGGRFLHLTGPVDKGTALRRLLALLSGEGRRFTTLALGDSPNDAGLLAAAQHAVVVPRPGGPDPELLAAVPGARVAPEPGPAGWNRALLEFLA